MTIVVKTRTIYNYNSKVNYILQGHWLGLGDPLPLSSCHRLVVITL